MGTTRLEAFSDGVIAIIITIMVLELKVPHEPTIEGLKPLLPVFLSYVLSFVYVAIYWNNHHHLFHVTKQVDGGVLWANLLLLFCLSLIPFTTGWMGENHFAAVPTALYGCTLLACAIAWPILVAAIRRCEGDRSLVARAMGADAKGKVSLLLYVVGIPLAFVSEWIAQVCYVAVALIWLVPDRRLARAVGRGE